ncbi:hypothetical protein D9Q98_002064 [Chlorella vulgaris]|uniref:Uncharacterized protein n=1 Tax=Chlorella vulgaris TaxID=3077 RepID=A0A9D4Z0W6_CHLVU|nr:hypothetical protein D9Q98_002064 [Chlorella vulgaris]
MTAVLRRSSQWGRHLSGATVSTTWRPPLMPPAARAASGAPDKPFENIQDPSQTHEAFRGGQQPPGSDPDVERELKPGKNVPTSAGQAQEELQYAGKGLAQSVEMGVNVLLSKAKDGVAAAQRAVGMQPKRGPEMSSEGMGAAGAMQHPPPGASSGYKSGPLSEDMAQAKYDEVAAAEKSSFPKGEGSVNELFPDMKVAAQEQSNTPERQHQENEDIRRELHKP